MPALLLVSFVAAAACGGGRREASLSPAATRPRGDMFAASSRDATGEAPTSLSNADAGARLHDDGGRGVACDAPSGCGAGRVCCWSPSRNGGRCVATVDDCGSPPSTCRDGTEGCFVLCRDERDCPAAPDGFKLRDCQERGAERGQLQNGCTYAFARTEDAERAISEARVPQGCVDEATCAAGCAKGDLGACARAFDLGRGFFDAGPEARGVALFRLACAHEHAAACNALGLAYGTGRGVALDRARSAERFTHACDLGHDPGHCGNAAGATCIAKLLSPAQRRPELDRFCNLVGRRAARPGEPLVNRAYEALSTMHDGNMPFPSDGCGEAMKSIGCFNVNAASVQRSAYCCAPSVR